MTDLLSLIPPDLVVLAVLAAIAWLFPSPKE